MVMANKIGWMVRVTKDNGRMVERKGMASCIMEMAIFTKVSGQMIKLMDMEYILMQMEQNILESGKTTSNTVKDMRHGLMEPFTKVSTAMGRNTETDDFNLLMDRCIPEPSV